MLTEVKARTVSETLDYVVAKALVNTFAVTRPRNLVTHRLKWRTRHCWMRWPKCLQTLRPTTFCETVGDVEADVSTRCITA